MQSQKLATIGDNNPPSDAESLQASLRDNHAESLRHAQQLLESANCIPSVINNDETAHKASDYVKLVNARIKTLEAARVSEKEPYLTLGRVVDGFFKSVVDQLGAAQTKAKRPLDAYLKAKADEERRERERLAAEARMKAEAEAAAAAALANANRAAESDAMMNRAAVTEQIAHRIEKSVDARPADLSRTRSSSGAVATLRTRWVGEIVSVDDLHLDTLRHHLSPDALQKAVNSYVAAGGRILRGAVIKEVSETVVR